MRTLIVGLLAVASWTAIPCQASIVIHGGAPGIVAESDKYFALDSNGEVWHWDPTFGWDHASAFDPPIPVQQILFWQRDTLITIFQEVWILDGGAWHSIGIWPDSPAGVGDEAPVAPMSQVSPNPSACPCRVSFQIATEGPVTVEVVGVTGRVLRRLLNGPHPAGDYSVIWDGRDDEGHEMPSGVYLARITTSEGSTTARVVVAR